MNRRIKKKRIRMFHKNFCHPSWSYINGLVRKPFEQLDEWQCPKCGWDSIDADYNLQIGRVLWKKRYPEGVSSEIEYKCPVCGTVFTYDLED